MANLALVAVLATSSLAVVGCDVKGKMEQIGFKQGDTVLEKGAIKFDTLIDKDENCNEKWADYQAQIQRRNDLIPQLVGVVQGAAAHEETTLIAVTQARANATRPEIQLQEARKNADGTVSNDFEDPNKIAQYQQAQGQLGATLSRLLVANEQYPQIAANQQFHDLQVQVEGTENRILRSREEFNLSVKEFNTELRHVSGLALNPITGMAFHPRQYFSADASANTAPTVNFGTPVGATAVQPAQPVPQVK
jgi:LemA protein